MLSLVQVSICYSSGPSVSPEVLRVDLLCSGVFSVRVFILPPSDGMLLRLYLSTGLGMDQAFLHGGVRAKGLLQAGGVQRRSHREVW